MNEPVPILVTLAAPSPIALSFQPVHQILAQIETSEAPILVTLPAPSPIELSLQSAPQIIAQVAISSAGLKGDKGDTGDRGNLFLGGYPTFGNLPPIDGVGVRIGDYALVNDVSIIYQVR